LGKGKINSHFKIYYDIKLNSKVYLCMLDTKQAFDTVWLDGVFQNFHQLRITGKMWSPLVDAQTCMSSCVSAMGFNQGFLKLNRVSDKVRVMSTWIYNLFIYDLLNTLKKSACGTYIIIKHSDRKHYAHG
jgi:hypothetical protein